MEIYFFLLFWSFITAIVYNLLKNNINKIILDRIYYLINYVPMGIVAVIRNVSVGTDTRMYHEFFYRYGILDFDWNYFDYSKVEIGYRLLNKIIYFFTSESNIYIFIISFCLIMGFGYFILINSVNIWISTFLFIGICFYSETLNTIRQSIACIILLNGYIFLKKEQYVKWLLSVLIATLFHSTAIFFLIFIILKKLTKIRIILINLIGILFYSLLVYDMNILMFFLDDNKYTYYLVENEASMGADVLRILLFIVVIVGTFFYRKVYTCAEKKDAIIWSIFLFYAIIMTLAKYQIEIFYRMVQYFSPYIVVILPLVLSKINNKYIKIILILFILILGVIVLYYLLNKNPNLYYKTFIL